MAKMNLLFVSTPTKETITAMTTAAGITYVAHGSTISGYKRGKEVRNRYVCDMSAEEGEPTI